MVEKGNQKPEILKKTLILHYRLKKNLKKMDFEKL